MTWIVRLLKPKRLPDLVVGDRGNPYLMRWELARFWGCQLALHSIRRSDDDRAPHDHVGWHASLMLAGGYLEHFYVRDALRQSKWRGPGAFAFRRAETPHRLELPVVNGGIRYAWTLWLRGPKVRDWGFWTAHGWVDDKTFERLYGSK